MKTILITGAGGFLGRTLLTRLTQNHTDPVQNDRFRLIVLTSRSDELSSTFPQTSYLSIMDSRELAAVKWGNIDILLNCAFPRDVRDSTHFAQGLAFISDLFFRAAHGGTGAAINISSQSVYSQTRTCPAEETSPVSPESPYAVGKYASELLANSLFHAVPHTNLRLSSLIGVGLEQRMVNRFVRRICAGEDISISGGGQIFGFLDVRDAADAMITILLSDPVKWEECYNVGRNGGYSLSEIVEEAVRTGENFGIHSQYRAIPGGETHNSALSCERFMTQFDWKPRISLRQTIRDIYNSYMKEDKNEIFR